MLAFTLFPRSRAARRRSLSDEALAGSWSEVVDMSTSVLSRRASRLILLNVGVLVPGRGDGEVMYAWRFSFRKEGVAA